MKSDKKDKINSSGKNKTEETPSGPGDRECLPAKKKETRVKNAHASGVGAIGRNSEDIPESGEGTNKDKESNHQY